MPNRVMTSAFGAFAINPLTGVITIDHAERLNPQLYPTHLLKVEAVNDRGDKALVAIEPALDEAK